MTNVYTRLLQPTMHYTLERSLCTVSLLRTVYKLHAVYKIMVRNASHPKNRPMC